MSVMLRSPQGDEVANHYGTYYNEKDIMNLKTGIVLDILCNDGLHYHVDLKEINIKTGNGKLHFCKWSKKYDYNGSLKDLYLAEKDKYSKLNNLSEKNNYADIESVFPSGSQPKKREKARNKFHNETKYPDDFLGPPKNSVSRTRINRSNDVGKSIQSNDDNNNDDDNDNDNDIDNYDDNEEQESLETDNTSEKVDTQTAEEKQVAPNRRNKQVGGAPLVQFNGINESRTGRTIKRSSHFDEVQTVDANKPKRKRTTKSDELGHEETSNKRKKATNIVTTDVITDIPATLLTMTPEEIEKKRRETILNTFVSSCAVASNSRELAKAINSLDSGRDIFVSLGLNVDQLKSLLAARKSIDQALGRLIEHKIRC